MGMGINYMHKYFWEECLRQCLKSWHSSLSKALLIKPKILQSASTGTLQLKVTVTTLCIHLPTVL